MYGVYRKHVDEMRDDLKLYQERPGLISIKELFVPFRAYFVVSMFSLVVFRKLDFPLAPFHFDFIMLDPLGWLHEVLRVMPVALVVSVLMLPAHFSIRPLVILLTRSERIATRVLLALLCILLFLALRYRKGS